MSYNQFLDITASSPDESAYPTEITWSLDNGQIKTVLILPDEDWEPWDNCGYETDVQHLMDQGVTAADIVRELNDDLSGKTVYVDGLDHDADLLEKLFESCGEEPAFELGQLSELFRGLDIETVYTRQRDIAEENALDLMHSSDTVRSLLFLNMAFPDGEL